ncbi:hypothetical protein E2C01_060047 [Portunus trituberculatus]|uniref:Uncharacterized protein n=1 Tax=Portunus trituberculatus TaxID=210409 RepID=A0A5B7H7T6_PORTR|nr:hypothetical protein [Portunus trituberculatus]
MRRRGVLAPPHGDGEGRKDIMPERQDTKKREAERGKGAPKVIVNDITRVEASEGLGGAEMWY